MRRNGCAVRVVWRRERAPSAAHSNSPQANFQGKKAASSLPSADRPPVGFAQDKPHSEKASTVRVDFAVGRGVLVGWRQEGPAYAQGRLWRGDAAEKRRHR
jgi:hypothetical protein